MSVLVLLCIVTAVVALVMLLWGPHESRYGAGLLSRRLRERKDELTTAVRSATPGPEAALAVALLGAGVLAGVPMFADLHRMLIPPSTGGGSGCSGGSGCGGGGGCGGCGGGGD